MSDGNGRVSLGDDVNPDYRSGCTVCTGSTANNIFFVNGKCKLDQMTYEQVVLVLKRHAGAAEQLRRITSDPALLSLANETKTYAQEEAEEKAAHARINGGPNSLPFYTSMRGVLPNR